ncbi:MAG TPA: glycosyltransferase family 4 protein [Corynebacteriales bacterium]|nr:glycosyltransferase family 4 protein [Mycobacteriales bacterium]
MRILMISWEYPPVMVGGLGIHVNNLVRELVQKGHELTVVTRAPDAAAGIAREITDEIRDGVRVVSVPLTPFAIDFTTDLMAWTLLMGTAMNRAIHHLINGTGPCKKLGAWQPDLVHGHDWLVAVPAVAAADECDVPLVGTFHATEAGRNSGWLSHPINKQVHSAEWWFANSCDKLIACSTSMVNEVEAVFGREDTGSPGLCEIHNIPNGIDPTGWECPRPPARKTSAPHLLYFGRLEWEKGVHDILSSLPLLRRRYPGIHATIAGKGMKQEWLKSEQHRHRLAGPVHFTGHLHRPDLKKLLSDADLAILPSRYEPFGIVALEAAAAGIPIVAAETGGLVNIVQDGTTGWTYPSGRIEEMVETIDSALQDTAAREKRPQLIKKQLDNFSWPKVADQTEEVYTEAAASTSRNAHRPLPRPLIPLRPLPHRDPTTPVNVATTVPH